MWPLSIVLLFATAAPQQNAPVQQGAYVGKIPQVQQMARDRMNVLQRTVHPSDFNQNTCFAIRSYHFERQDGQAPMLTAMTTCTPARILEQKRVSPAPGVMYVPLALQPTVKEGLVK
jgi:hypothetical protein